MGGPELEKFHCVCVYMCFGPPRTATLGVQGPWTKRSWDILLPLQIKIVLMEQTVDMQEDGWVYFKASPRGETHKHTQKDKKNKTKQNQQTTSGYHVITLLLSSFVVPYTSCLCLNYFLCMCVRVCVSLLFFLPSRLCLMDFPDPKQL